MSDIALPRSARLVPSPRGHGSLETTCRASKNPWLGRLNAVRLARGQYCVIGGCRFLINASVQKSRAKQGDRCRCCRLDVNTSSSKSVDFVTALLALRNGLRNGTPASARRVRRQMRACGACIGTLAARTAENACTIGARRDADEQDIRRLDGAMLQSRGGPSRCGANKRIRWWILEETSFSVRHAVFYRDQKNLDMVRSIAIVRS
jgi:hypothetical protein